MHALEHSLLVVFSWVVTLCSLVGGYQLSTETLVATYMTQSQRL